MFAMFGQLLCAWIAGHIRVRLIKQRARKVDASIGSALGVVSVLVVAWMVAVPLASSPYPALASEASHSRIVRAVDGVMPDDVRTLYSSLRTFLNQSGFPPVFGDLPSAPIISVPAPESQLPDDVAARVRQAHKSIFKIYGEAPSCNRAIEGTGFVYAPHRIITNAHVVAGTSQVGVQVSPTVTVPATVVLYDPTRDVAVLSVPDIDAPPLQFAQQPAATGDSAVVLGYPENGPFDVQPARVRSQTTVAGHDIYGNGDVHREIYAIRATVRSGNSGGPLLADDGRVLGMVFATALDSSDTGFVLTDEEIMPDAQRGVSDTIKASTGACTPG
jgi:S1-C subfamily serine protease